MTRYRLSEISTISSGVTLRDKSVFTPEGDCLVIQPSNVRAEKWGAFHSEPEKINSSSIKETDLLHAGQVIFLAKGNSNFAWIYTGDKKAIATNLFFVITPDPSIITAEWLRVQMNFDCIKLGGLYNKRQGQQTPYISLDDLKDHQIKVPPIVTQNKLTNLIHLWQIEKDKTRQLLEAKELFVNETMARLVDKSEL